ncbi:Pro-apoptotic serine protease [[Candida] zeylanoides]
MSELKRSREGGAGRAKRRAVRAAEPATAATDTRGASDDSSGSDDASGSDASGSDDAGDSDYSSEGAARDGAAPGAAPNAASPWQSTITKVVQAVVSIQFAHVSSFDTETSLVSEATGFVVDARRGLILTNRHVVGPGPFCGYAVFDNHEEAVVKPIYRDPIHDFGFLEFAPHDVKYMEVVELELRPQLARVGTEIRVIGNDAGEKLSILAGFISRLDRNAPDYGLLMYNDFNTEYIQAAASASGGSSGSPVVNREGYAVALQAGGSSEASTDFFLPVARPQRALECIRRGAAVTRGDVQVEWQLRPFDECRRLGLSRDAERAARQHFPNHIGLLVANLVLPEGPASGLLQEGDTLISVCGECVASHVRVDELLDERVGERVEFVVQRNRQAHAFEIVVGDLHAITPSRYVECCGATFNDLSYQVARSYAMPVRGVYVCDASGTFEFSPYERSGWLVESVDDKPTPNLDAFVEVMRHIPDRHKVSVVYRHASDLHGESVMVVYVERHWQSAFRMATRDDASGLWRFEDLGGEVPVAVPEPKYAKFIDLKGVGGAAAANGSAAGGATDGTARANGAASRDSAGCAPQLVRSFAQVRCILPIPLDSFPYRKERGYGVVVDSAHGYVLVSRRFVPHDMCDIILTFADSIDVSARVVFLHPNQNYAIVQYDPSLVLADVRTPRMSSTPLQRGDRSLFVGYNYNFRVVTDDVKVSAISSLNIPLSASQARYRGTNLECIVLDSKLCQECDTGVLADYDGTVRSFWLTYLGETSSETQTERMYHMGLDVTDVRDVIDSLRREEVPRGLRILDAEFQSISMIQGRTRGVPQEWITRFEEECDDELKFLQVDRVAAQPAAPQPQAGAGPDGGVAGSTGAASGFRTGDILLSVNSRIVHTMRDLTVMYHQPFLDFTVVRHKQEVTLRVPTIDTSTINTSHVVFWCGAVLQAPHHGVRQAVESLPSGVYVTHKSSGGPAHQYGVSTNSFITHVNDHPTATVEQFVAVVRSIADATYVKLRVVFDKVPDAISVKTNYHYFPTGELRRANGRWIEVEHKPEGEVTKEIAQ